MKRPGQKFEKMRAFYGNCDHETTDTMFLKSVIILRSFCGRFIVTFLHKATLVVLTVVWGRWTCQEEVSYDIVREEILLFDCFIELVVVFHYRCAGALYL